MPPINLRVIKMGDAVGCLVCSNQYESVTSSVRAVPTEFDETADTDFVKECRDLVRRIISWQTSDVELDERHRFCIGDR